MNIEKRRVFCLAGCLLTLFAVQDECKDGGMTVPIDVIVSMLMMCSGQEEVDPKKIMVGGMPYFITEDDIHEFFEDCGIIAELDCVTFADTGKFKGIAFITFKVIYFGFESLSCFTSADLLPISTVYTFCTTCKGFFLAFLLKEVHFLYLI